MTHELSNLLQRVEKFELDAHAILGVHETAVSSRTANLEHSYDKLSLLSLKQDELFRQALRCVESQLYGAAHVMSWAACMDFLEEMLDKVGIKTVLAAYPAWPKVKDVHELAEYIPERQIVEALKKVGLATKNEVKALIGLLDRRNECAHPTAYMPGTNETLGYVAEILKRVEMLSKKSTP